MGRIKLWVHVSPPGRKLITAKEERPDLIDQAALLLYPLSSGKGWGGATPPVPAGSGNGNCLSPK